MPKLSFKVLFDSDLEDFCVEKTLQPIKKKSAVGFANSFEDGKWCSSQFHQFIWNNIAETALSKKERDALVDNPATLTMRAAENLRLTESEKDIGRGSELAEIFLYGIMRHHYNALPVVPKVYHKQNVQDNAKGADSVHIVLEENANGFSVWFGEAKFYSSIEDSRLDSIIESVNNSLSTEKLKKENSIILDLDDLREYIKSDKVFEQVKNLLANDTSIDELKPFLHIPILLLYECNITKECVEFTPEYKQKITKFQQERAEAYFKRQITQLGSSVFKYSEIYFHLILFPVPDKNAIIRRFIDTVSFKKKEARND